MFAAEIDWTASTLAGLVALIVAGVPAYITIKTAWQTIKEKDAELEKKNRNGVIQGEVEFSDRLQTRIEELLDEIKGLRGQITDLYKVNRALQELGMAKDKRIESQAGQVEELQTAVVLADAAAVAKPLEGPAPVVIQAEMTVNDMKVDSMSVKEKNASEAKTATETKEP